MKTKLTSFLLAVTALSVAHLSAQVPQLINYQGRVAVDGVNFDGAGQFKFALVDGGTDTTPTHITATGSVQVVNGFVVGVTVSDGGSGYATPPAVIVTGAGSGATATAVLAGDVVTSVTIDNPGSGYTGTPTVSFGAPPAPVETTAYINYWSNDGTSSDGSEPTASVSLQVKKGLYSVLLGDATVANMTTVPAAIFSNPGVFLRVWFNDGANGFQLLTPDQRIAAVGYAVMAGTVTDGAITADKLAPDAVSDSLAASGQGTVPSGAMIMSSLDNDGNLTNQGYTQTSGIFKSVEPNDPDTVPISDVGSTAVWTGSQMIVWGGGNYTNTGAVYTPSTDTWSKTSVTNAPSGRSGHTAIWTGSKMIIWGGAADSNNEFNNGGIYDPLTDEWTSLGSGGLSNRKDHTAIWTGSKMIIWGGYKNSIGRNNTGAMYDPDNGSWTATSLVNAPTKRQGHSAVWTGSQMVIWGGYITSSYTNTGACFDPDTNTWIRETSITNAPSHRQSHSVVWTGTKMIIWGGISSSRHNSGAAYNPVNNTWSETAMENAPSARSAHTAIWTGSKMIIWGGGSGGGGYDPSTDLWNAVTGHNAPTSRSNHVSVWTGSDMIIWGGGEAEHSTGGIYKPGSDNSRAWRKVADINGKEKVLYIYFKP